MNLQVCVCWGGGGGGCNEAGEGVVRRMSLCASARRRCLFVHVTPVRACFFFVGEEPAHLKAVSRSLECTVVWLFLKYEYDMKSN